MLLYTKHFCFSNKHQTIKTCFAVLMVQFIDNLYPGFGGNTCKIQGFKVEINSNTGLL